MPDTFDTDIHPDGIFYPASLPTSLNLGTITDGYLRETWGDGTPREDEDWFRFHVPAGQSFRVYVDALDENIGPDEQDHRIFVTLYDRRDLSNSVTTGSTSQDAVARIFERADDDTEYYLQLETSAFTDLDFGAYTITLFLADEGLPDARDLAPNVTDAGNAASAENDLGTVKDGLWIGDFRLGGGDAQDTFHFFSPYTGTLSARTFLGLDGSTARDFSIAVEQGHNVIRVTPGSPYEEVTSYRLILDFGLFTGAQDARIEKWSNEQCVGLLKLGTVDIRKFLFDNMLVLDDFFEGAYSTETARKIFKEYGENLGRLGQGVDILGRLETVLAAVAVDADPKRAFFAEFVDMIIGQLVSKAAAGIGGTVGLAGGPFASLGLAVVGDFVGGIAYGATLSNHVKDWAREFYDEASGQNWLELDTEISQEELDQLTAATVGRMASSTVDVSEFRIDPDYVLEQSAAARSAYENGEIADVTAWYIEQGIAEGLAPNDGAEVMDIEDLAVDPAQLSSERGFSSSVYLVPLEELAGDGLSQAESDLADQINLMRAADAPLVMNTNLNAYANRVAREWMTNHVERPTDRMLEAETSVGWGWDMADGEDFRIATANASIGGRTISVHSGQQVVVGESRTSSPGDVLAALAPGGGTGELTTGLYKSFGVAEYGGLWVVTLDDRLLAEGGTVSSEVVTAYLTGDGDGEIFRAGAGRADVLMMDGADRFEGGAYDDVADGGAGRDILSGGAGHDRLLGGDGFDVLGGGLGGDSLFGGQGDDRLVGFDGYDLVSGGQGADDLSGGIGRDTLQGGAGQDTLNAGRGDDEVQGGDGRDLAFLGAGDDVFFDTTQGAPFNNDTVWAGDGNDRILGGNGFDDFRGQDGNDFIRAGKGADSIFGGGQGDTLHGNDGNDLVIGGLGMDEAILGTGFDTWWDDAQAQFGDDRVYGGGGWDTMHSAGGDDTLTGGAGADRFNFAAGIGDMRVTDFTPGEDEIGLATALWSDPLNQTQLAARSSVENGALVLALDTGATLTLEGLTSSAGLLGDIVLV